MTDAFAAAMNDLYADPNIAADAVYQPDAGGPSQNVKIILRRPDQLGSFGETRLVAGAVLIEVRQFEIPEPQEGDAFVINGISYVVQCEPISDATQLLWSIEARQETP